MPLSLSASQPLSLNDRLCSWLYIFLFSLCISLTLAPDQAFSQCASSFDCTSSGITYTDTTLSDIAPNGLALQNQKITISGTFTVDRYLGLYNCSVRMMPNARIVTEGNVLLILSCNKFYTCTNGDLWSDLQISKGCFFFITDNHFQDAYAAIVFEPGYKALTPTSGWPFTNLMTGNTFDNNNIGIQMGFRQSEAVFFSPMVFHSNKFTQSGSLKKIGGSAFTGVLMHKCNGTLGSSTEDNVFEKTRNGIVMYNSTVTVQNCLFEGMVIPFTNPSPSDGVGVFASGSTLTIDKAGNSGCVFESNRRSGILSWGTRKLTVKNTLFTDQVDAGQPNAIRVENSQVGSQFFIEKNDIYMNDRQDENGISIERPPSSLGSPNWSSEIKFNQIRVNGTAGGVGIRTHASSETLQDFLFIRDNNIDFQVRPLFRDAVGILSQGLATGGAIQRGLRIQSNQVGFTSTTTSILPNLANWGIGVNYVNSGEVPLESSGRRNFVVNNQVTAARIDNNGGFNDNNNNSIALCGIHLTSRNLVVRDNITDKTHRGFHIKGDNSKCDFGCNHMNQHTYGLHAQVSPDLSDQIHKGNTWIDDASAYFINGAEYNPGAEPWITGPPPPFRFFVNPDIPSGRMPPSVNPEEGWFIKDPNNVDDCGRAFSPEAPSSHRYGGISATDQRVIDESSTLDLSVKTWDERRSLAIRLLQSPVLIDSNAQAAAWFAAATGTSAKKFAEAERIVQGAWTCPTALALALYNARNDAEQWSDSLGIMVATLEQAPADTVLWQQYLGLLPFWEYADQQVDTLQKQIAAVHRSNFLDVLPIVLALPDTALYERNLKYLLRHYIHSALGLSTSIGTLDTLFYIGTQCPDIGGISVQDALRWLPEEQVQQYLGEGRYACDTAQQRKLVKSPEQLTDILIVPNPAADRVEVRSGLANALRWNLWNSQGNKVSEGLSSTSSFTVEISSLPVGIYLLSAHSTDGHFRLAKLVITR